ncbi:ATP-binding protein [Rhodospirillum sp. A1_3_36]|uniref:hybrid sensor histidine kinase/response regulator n=1 Tax=Rhodospirillum sp. A1_3_36 TaxID=3391666 RepID=UPI0039A54D18
MNDPRRIKSVLEEGGRVAAGRQAVAILDRQDRLLSWDEGLSSLLGPGLRPLKKGGAISDLLEPLAIVPASSGQDCFRTLDGRDLEIVTLTLGEGDQRVLSVRNIGELNRAVGVVRQIFQFAPFPMFMVEASSRVVSRINNRAAELFPYPPGQGQVTHTLDDYIGSKNRRRFMGRMERQGFVEDMEAEVTTLYGQTLSVLLSGQRIEAGADNLLFVSINDITDRKNLESQANRVFEVAPAWLLLCRRVDGMLIRINRRASEVFGNTVSPNGQSWKTIPDLFGQEAWNEFRLRLENGGYVDDFETQLQTEYGEILWVLLTGQAITVEDESCILVGANDISDRKLAEEELTLARNEAMSHARAKSSFLASMSHEIRTPLNGVLSTLDLLSTSVVGSQESYLLSLCRDSGETLMTIINDILDTSKIEAGMLSLERVPFSVSDVVESAAELLARKAEEKGLELVVYVDPRMRSSLVGDAVRIRQILLNLIGNAVKFTDRGHVSVRMGLQGVADGKANLRFDVSDSGIGLSPEQQSRLFRPFSQAEDDTARRFGGTGLGLSISKRLVEMMGGRIGVVSKEGKGATFWFRLSLPVVEDEQDGASEKCEGPDLSGYRVLVATVGEVTRKGILAYLKAAKARISDLGTPLDLLILDDAIPREDREEIVELAGAGGGTDRRPAVLLLAARGNAGQDTAGRADAIVTKPVRRDVFLETVALLCDPEAAPGQGRHAAVAARPLGWVAPSREDATLAKAMVLIVDDNKTNLIVLGRFLERLGFAYDMVSSGEEALELLRNPNAGYGILITDLQMPGLDGFGLVAAWREQEEALGSARLPVVALTADVMPETVLRCTEVGMDAYLTKPIDPKALEDMLVRRFPVGATLRREEAPEELAPSSSGVSLESGPQLREDGGRELGNPAMNEEIPVLDLSSILFIFDSFTAEARAMLTDNVDRVAPILEDATAQLSEGEGTEVLALLHAAKGAANTTGALALGALCARLESLVLSGEIDQAAREAKDRIPGALAEVRAAIASQ